MPSPNDLYSYIGKSFHLKKIFFVEIKKFPRNSRKEIL